jgi:hypothetical protein
VAYALPACFDLYKVIIRNVGIYIGIKAQQILSKMYMCGVKIQYWQLKLLKFFKNINELTNFLQFWTTFFVPSLTKFSVHVCLYIYICIYTYIHTYTFMPDDLAEFITCKTGISDKLLFIIEYAVCWIKHCVSRGTVLLSIKFMVVAFKPLACCL